MSDAPAALPIRVVSLVPSLTEAIAETCPGALVGATDWCTHPADLDVTRLRGTKNPDLEGVRALRPDLVVVNREENRADDIDALRAGGLEVWITDPETVPQALDQLRSLLARLGARRVPWLDAAETAWRAPWTGHRRTALVPIWRRPWMALGRDTFAGDLLARLGVDHCFASHAERYPRFDVAAVPPVELVLLPDEPYRFTADDGPQAFPELRCALVSGRHLTWYGPSLAEAREVLLRQLAGSTA
ncbi:MAG TPA: helical backbone metal receptor [Nocardioidaceae bacterium]|nr:helical backbone metal receptor [Nocardioidaceae bacterium]